VKEETAMTNEIDHLAVRVKKLERENRFFKLTGAVLACGVLVFIVLGATNKPRIIEAERITLLDTQGRPRLTIGTPETSGAAISMRSNEPAIWLSDEKGIDRAILTSDGLYLANEKARPTVDLISGSTSEASSLRFYDSGGKLFRSIP
jgi:hypothetical protein